MQVEDYIFSQIENPEDIEKFSVEGFEFFKGLGIIDYKRTFKAWLRKFPKPLFLIVTRQNKIVSWVHIDEWREGVARDGNSINILRAIETLPKYRGKKIGYRLVFLGLQRTVGYTITKPVSPGSKRFFSDIGFLDETHFKNCPVDLSKHPGYMVLPLYKKSVFLKDFVKKYIGNNSKINLMKPERYNSGDNKGNVSKNEKSLSGK
jgi:hypothetical protein